MCVCAGMSSMDGLMSEIPAAVKIVVSGGKMYLYCVVQCEEKCTQC